MKLHPNSSRYALFHQVSERGFGDESEGNRASPALDVEQSLCMRIPVIAIVWRAEMDLVFVQRIRDLVGENAG